MRTIKAALWVSVSVLGAVGALPVAVAVADSDQASEAPRVGSYDVEITSQAGGVQQRRWVLHDWCGPDCRNVVSSGVWGDGRTTGFDGELRLVDGRWEMTVDNPHAVICPDGRQAAWTTTYSLDPAAMTGTSKSSTAADCDGAAQSSEGTFTLTFLA